jgi:hypothetical protein
MGVGQIPRWRRYADVERRTFMGPNATALSQRGLWSAASESERLSVVLASALQTASVGSGPSALPDAFGRRPARTLVPGNQETLTRRPAPAARGEKLDGGRAATRNRSAHVVFLMSLTGIPPTRVRSQVHADPDCSARGPCWAGGPGRGLQRSVGIFLPARGRPHVHEIATEQAPSRLPVAVLAALAVAALVTLIGGISPGSLARWAVLP